MPKHEIELKNAAENAADVAIDGSKADDMPAPDIFADQPAPRSSSYQFVTITRARAELIVFDQIAAAMGVRFEIQRERKLGSSSVDGVLVARQRTDADLVVEVKVIRTGFKTGWLLEVLQKTTALVDLYASEYRAKAGGLVIIVGSHEWLKRQ